MASQFKSNWEMSVARSLSKNGISFEYEPVTFYLNNRLRYTPDFVLDMRQDSKTIIVEPHGIMGSEDFDKFSLFRQIYGEEYFLILLVRNDNIPLVSEEAYDDIWPIEYVELLFRKLRVGSNAT